MSLKTLFAPVLRLLGRAAMDTARKTARDLSEPEKKRPAKEKAARASVKKARQAARVTRRRG